MRFVLSLLVATLLAAGLGVAYARFLRPPVASEQAKPKTEAAEPAAVDAKGAHGEAKGAHGEAKGAHGDAKGGHGDPKAGPRAGLVELPPIVGNLAAPAGVWVRLEASITVDPMEAKELEKMRGEVTQDMLAYLATLTLPQIQGSLGLQHLREDLDERLAIRSARRARDLVIHTLVVQ